MGRFQYECVARGWNGSGGAVGVLAPSLNTRDHQSAQPRRGRMATAELLGLHGFSLARDTVPAIGDSLAHTANQ